MSHLEASLRDFSITWDGEKEESFSFRFGRCESFNDTLEEFKERIPLKHRRAEPDRSWLWTVIVTPATKAALSDLFDNFESCYEACRGQLRMFDRGA